jgi:hypothetical protein
MGKAIAMEFTTTATIRPELLARTYASFTAHMHGVDYAKSTLYLNVDPVGRADRTARDVCAAAREYFGTVRTRTPGTGNYAAAYRWLWSQPQGAVFFNLEDDWEVVEEFDLREIIAVPKVAEWVGVALRAYTHKDNGDPYPYKTCPTSPSLLRSSFFHNFALKMDDTVNPEVQLHRYMKQEFFTGKRRRPGTRMRCYPFGGPLRAVVRDTGREWMARYPVARPCGPKEGFTTWTR